MQQVNSHEYQGTVLAKSCPFPVGTNGMVKSFLYMEGDYMVAGKLRKQNAKFVCFSFGDHKSRVSDIFPGDVVKFSFTLSGWYKPDEKDYLGAIKCYTDAVLESKVEILDQTNRKLYDNRLDKEDDLGGTASEAEGGNDGSDLPF